MLIDLKHEKKVVGAKQVKRALNSSKVDKVYIAEDAEKRVISDIVKRCEEMHIPVVYIKTMNKLGNACGIDINAAVAALII